jgi:hypothetical protein
MTDEQTVAIFSEMLRITRGFTEAVRQIAEMKAEIVALQWVLESKGVSYQEMDAARDEVLKRLGLAVQPGTPLSLEMVQALLELDNKWKM